MRTNTTELEWLAATLNSTADRLRRAAALLDAAEAAEKLLTRVAAIAPTATATASVQRSTPAAEQPPRPPQSKATIAEIATPARRAATAVATLPPRAATPRPPRRPDVGEFRPGTTPKSGNRDAAVFDHVVHSRQLVAFEFAEDEVPF